MINPVRVEDDNSDADLPEPDFDALYEQMLSDRAAERQACEPSWAQ